MAGPLSELVRAIAEHEPFAVLARRLANVPGLGLVAMAGNWRCRRT